MDNHTYGRRHQIKMCPLWPRNHDGSVRIRTETKENIR